MRSSPWRADQDRLVTHLDVGVAAQRHGHVVHAHGADQRVARAPDQHVAVVGQRAPPAVPVADRQRSRPSVGSVGASSAARSPRCPPARSASPRPRSSQRQRRLQAMRERVLAGRGPARRSPRRSAPCRSGPPGRAAWRRCWRRAPSPRRGAPGPRRRTPGSGRAGRGKWSSPELVGGGEVGHHPGQLDPLVRGRLVHDRARLPRVLRAEPAHSGVELDVHPRPRAASARRNSMSQTATSASTARVRARPVSAPITRIRPPIPASRSSAASAAVATASQSAPPAAPRARTHRAVPVAVGLHHRAQLRRRRPRAQAPRSCASIAASRMRASARSGIRLSETSAPSTSTRVTTPTSRPCSTTGRRLCPSRG